MTDYTDRGTINLDQTDVRLPDGTRLTEARAQALVDEVLERAGRGRPSLSAPGTRSPQLRLSVPADLRSRLNRRAQTEHRSTSSVVREAIEHYLAS
jgi:hypothetical protein